MKIGVIGVGMVGSAIVNASKSCEVSAYDKFHPDRDINPEKMVESELIFVSVPTPTIDGRQDLVAMLEVMGKLHYLKYKGVVVIKSTVLPGVTDYLKKDHPDLRLVHNPEFLCEKSALHDFLTQPHVIASGEPIDVEVLKKYLDFVGIKYDKFLTTERYSTTEFSKYIHNCILPVMLSFLNEVHDLCSDFDLAVEMAELFGNVGELNQVPGPDGRRGWGGSCFVKDTIAFRDWAKQKGCTMPTLSGAILTNQFIRPSAYNGQEKTGLINKPHWPPTAAETAAIAAYAANTEE